jgi:LAS superfamily LD-carboxypeptidase LdcB
MPAIGATIGGSPPASVGDSLRRDGGTAPVSLHSRVALGAGPGPTRRTRLGTPLTTSRRRSLLIRLLAAALVVGAPWLAPSPPASAGPGQPGPGTQGGGQLEPPDAASDPTLRSSDAAEISTTLDDLGEEVDARVADVLAAREAEAAAADELAEADAAVAETEELIDGLTTASDRVVVDSFMNPPAEDAIDTLTADSLAAATVKQAILRNEADANAAVLDQLQAAQAELETLKEEQEEAATAADERASEAAQALEDLVAQQSAETLFVLTVQDRMEQNLAEADALEGLDPDAAAAMRARESELAAKIEEIVSAREQQAAEERLEQALAEAAERAAEQAEQATSSSGGVSIGAASGSLATVSCPGGGSITVDSSLSGNLQAMLDAAAADGLYLCGGGYRDPSAQIELRRQNCGTSDYAIYEAPSSSCSPPTARPGTSNHEQGLAIDFTCDGGGTISSSSPCFAWLVDNAASYGLYNLPSEPWHWSNDGT